MERRGEKFIRTFSRPHGPSLDGVFPSFPALLYWNVLPFRVWLSRKAHMISLMAIDSVRAAKNAHSSHSIW